MLEQFTGILLIFLPDLSIKTDRFLVHTVLDDLLKTVERTTANK